MVHVVIAQGITTICILSSMVFNTNNVGNQIQCQHDVFMQAEYEATYIHRSPTVFYFSHITAMVDINSRIWLYRSKYSQTSLI